MTLLDLIYLNYLEEIKKVRAKNPTKSDKEVREGALGQTIFAITKCLEGDTATRFDGFTSKGQCRLNIINLCGNNMGVFRRTFAREYAAMLYSASQDSLGSNKENMLYQVIKGVRSKERACQALQDFVDYGDFGSFMLGSNSYNQIRELDYSISRETLATMALGTIVRAKELEDRKRTEACEQRHGGVVKNLRFNTPFARRCAVIAATSEEWQMTKQQSFSVGDDLYAVADKGMVRTNQEDSVLIMYHPQNPDFKMLVVSDGVGGVDGGEFASSFVVEMMRGWFERLDKRWYDAPHIEKLRKEFEKAIIATSNALCEQNKRTGHSGIATFCGAIVGEKGTIISNVGDSRAYVYGDGELRQLTQDDSVVWLLNKPQTPKDKERLRFSEGANVITQSMGEDSEAGISPRSTIISNDAYECLMLFSDGVTDCLSDEKIKAITATTPRNKLAQMLVEKAKTTESIPPKEWSGPGYKASIPAGKDNTTAAVYAKKKGGNEYGH